MRFKTSALWFALLSASLSASCGGAAPEPIQPAQPPAPAPTPPVAGTAGAPAPATAGTAAPAPVAAAPKPDAEDAPPTPQDYATAEAKAQGEKDRFTPELRQQAKALASAKYATLRAALDAVLKSPVRKPGHADRDAYRHPIETLEFIGITPKMTVFEYGPGEGWYTEILAPVLAKSGKLIVTSPDPKGPLTDRGTFAAKGLDMFLDKSPELFGKVERVVVDAKAPSLPEDGTVDAVLVFRALHGMENQGTMDAWLAAFHKALKPSGILGVEQHRAHTGDDPKKSAKQGYLPEEFVIAEVEKAGFKLAGKSEINANSKDTKDYAEGVWSLPPTLRLGIKDREKYIAIGESDRMTLKFVKTGK
jgi:predicted methyltransferase